MDSNGHSLLPPKPVTDNEFGLPALKGLGKLHGALPTVVVDTREQMPLPIKRLPCVRGTLSAGDYSCQGLTNLFSLERKSLDDLFGTLSVGRERFLREIARLRGYRFKRIIVIGSEQELLDGPRWSRMNPKAVLHSLYSIEAKGVPVVFSPTPESAGRLVERYVFWFSRAVVEESNSLLRGCREGETDITPSQSQGPCAGKRS